MSRSVFYITAGNMEEAENIAKQMVEKKLVACVNIIPRIKSVFYWEGEAQVEEEVLLTGKTRTALINELVEFVNEQHSYEVPCVISWTIENGQPQFLEWIDQETQRT